MPTWNRAGIIGAAIRSVQAQSFQDWELIVVDDGSEDDTASVLRGFAGDPRIRYLPRDHQGLCHTRNHALAQARAPIIAYLDSDNVWYPGFLAAVVSTFAAEPTVDCVYGALVIDSAFGPGLLFHAYDRASLEQGNYIDVNTFAHRRTMFERYGGFDPALRRLDDWDLVLRYTAEKPPRRLPILAARYRTMDALRVTQTELIEPDIVHIRAKLDAQDSPRGR
jgi:glycosyltransferase involved in cell wall biosynthesis